MSIFLQRTDFEWACKGAGIVDMERDGEGYKNPTTQATYVVWLSAAQPATGMGNQPVSWATRRAGRVHSVVFARPRGPHSDGWLERDVVKGWDAPMPLFGNVPAASDSAMSVIMERQRLLTDESCSIEHDQQFKHGELARAAACYAFQAGGLQPFAWLRFWPWPASPMKAGNATESLINAGAMIQRELERKAAKSAG